MLTQFKTIDALVDEIEYLEDNDMPVPVDLQMEAASVGYMPKEDHRDGAEE